jgi:hypothetical protein
MPGFTAVAAGVSMAAALGQGAGGAAQAAKFKKDQKRAQRAASRAVEESERLLSRNVAEELRIKTFAFDEGLRRQASRTAQAVDALQGAGARGVLGGLQAVQAQATKETTDILAGLEEREIKRQEAVLKQEQANIDALGEIAQAEAKGATAAGIQAATARAQAIGDAMSGFGAMATKATEFMGLYDTTVTERLAADVYKKFEGNVDALQEIMGDAYSTDIKTQLDFFGKLDKERLRELKKFGLTQDASGGMGGTGSSLGDILNISTGGNPSMGGTGKYSGIGAIERASDFIEGLTGQ